MNKKQRITVITSCLITATMAMFPPWHEYAGARGGVRVMKPLGYSPIFNPPVYAEYAEVDLGRLLIQSAGVAIFAAAIAMMLRTSVRPDCMKKSGD